MQFAIGIILFMMAAGTLLYMAYQAYRGVVPIISTRNFFLLGFTLFQLLSGTISLTFDMWDDLRPENPSTAGLILTAMAVPFLLFFTWSYSRGWIVRRVAARINPVYPSPEPVTMLTVSMIFLVLGTVCRLALMRIPLAGVVFDIVGYAFLSVAAGMAMYVWAPRLMNPFVASIAGFVILVAVLVVINRAFGRRDLISVLVAVLWAAYHGHWKFQGGRFTIVRLGAIAAAGVMLVAAFTATRVAQNERLTTSQYIQAFNPAEMAKGFLQLGTGQFAAANSMWLIENHPGNFPWDPFHMIIYAVVQPVPRAIWETKPEGLGYTMVRDARVIQKAAEFNFGPGILGHIANDNPFLALIPYAILFGLLLRLLDEAVRLHGTNPFVLIPVGVALGEITGLARGETGLFLFRATLATTGAWIMVRFTARSMRTMGFPELMPAAYAPDDGGSDHDAFADAPADDGSGSDRWSDSDPGPDWPVDPQLAAAYTESPANVAAADPAPSPSAPANPHSTGPSRG